MSFLGLQCVGHLEVSSSLTRAGSAVEAIAVPTALDFAALLVERRAKQIVVEKDIIDTGNLLGSIFVDPEKGAVSRSIVSGAEYSVYNEFGTVKMPARPYMRPALDESADEISRIFGGAVTTTLAAAL